MSINDNDNTGRPDVLYVTDDELIRRLGVPDKIARDAIRALDSRVAESKFPQKQALWGGRRYWPAVRAWMDKVYGAKLETSPRSDPLHRRHS